MSASSADRQPPGQEGVGTKAAASSECGETLMEACVLSENWMLLQQALSQVASNLCLHSQATGVVLVSHG